MRDHVIALMRGRISLECGDTIRGYDLAADAIIAYLRAATPPPDTLVSTPLTTKPVVVSETAADYTQAPPETRDTAAMGEATNAWAAFKTAYLARFRAWPKGGIDGMQTLNKFFATNPTPAQDERS